MLHTVGPPGYAAPHASTGAGTRASKAPTKSATIRVVTIAPGDIISDRYRVVDKIGEGGMGAVFRAEHVHMRKMVALKVLLSELARHEEVVARFEREAVSAANIEHPNVATATDFGRLPDGSFFLVMEYVPGRSLRAELENGRLEPARALKITRGILGAIEAAHLKNIVHRDLKPENVMLVERDGDPDFVKVLDFGIAKTDVMTGDPAKPGLTRTGAVMGTPEYMAPEQAVGQQVDARSDLYSLGIIMYEMLAGFPPFSGEPIVGAGSSAPERRSRSRPRARPDPREAPREGAAESLRRREAPPRCAQPAELGPAHRPRRPAGKDSAGSIRDREDARPCTPAAAEDFAKAHDDRRRSARRPRRHHRNRDGDRFGRQRKSGDGTVGFRIRKRRGRCTSAVTHSAGVRVGDGRSGSGSGGSFVGAATESRHGDGAEEGLVEGATAPHRTGRHLHPAAQYLVQVGAVSREADRSG